MLTRAPHVDNGQPELPSIKTRVRPLPSARRGRDVLTLVLRQGFMQARWPRSHGGPQTYVGRRFSGAMAPAMDSAPPKGCPTAIPLPSLQAFKPSGPSVESLWLSHASAAL